MNNFYQFKQIDETVTELSIYGDITSWVWDEAEMSADKFRAQLDAVSTPNLNVRINSYGGEVKEALAIYNMLQDFKGKVTTINDGFACSAAASIFMAGAERIMNTGSLLMIHNAWTYAAGNANELRKQADDLDKISNSTIELYKKSGLSEEELKQLFDAETWLTADEAVEYGFATSKREESVKQSLESNALSRTVMKLKELESQLNSQPEEPVKKSSWDGFFKS